MEALTEKTIRSEQVRVGRRLEYFTLSWNLGEATVAVGAGLFAGSIALTGFGIRLANRKFVRQYFAVAFARNRHRRTTRAACAQTGWDQLFCAGAVCCVRSGQVAR